MTDTPILTTSERRAFKRCPQRWWWGYREGLVAHETDIKLWFGIGVHLALAHYYGKPGYKRQMDFIDVWRTFCDEDDMSRSIRTRPFDDAEQVWVDARALGESMLSGYHERWQGDPTWDMIYTERPFQIAVPDPRDENADIVLFTSTFDGVFRDKVDRMIKLQEHKTAASIQTGYLGMDDQGGGYWAVASLVLADEGILTKGQKIGGIEYNFLRKALPDERPKDAQGYATNNPKKEHYMAALAERSIYPKPATTIPALAELAAGEGLTVVGDRSATQPGPLFERVTVLRTARERATQVRRIQSEALAMEPFRSGELELYKNPTRDCSWDCPFNTMCELHDQGADFEEFRDGVFLRRDPYDRYRKSAAEGT